MKPDYQRTKRGPEQSLPVFSEPLRCVVHERADRDQLCIRISDDAAPHQISIASEGVCNLNEVFVMDVEFIPSDPLALAVNELGDAVANGPLARVAGPILS